MQIKYKFRVLASLFLLITALIGNSYLSININTHIENQRQVIKNLTEDDKKTRYKVYKDGNDLRSVLKIYTAFSFISILLVATMLLICDKTYNKRLPNAKP